MGLFSRLTGGVQTSCKFVYKDDIKQYQCKYKVGNDKKTVRCTHKRCKQVLTFF